MEDIVSEVTAQALNQLHGENVEQARQEFERASGEDTNALPDNVFDGTLIPIGSAEELHYMCTLLRDHMASLLVDELVDGVNLVYNMQINDENGQSHVYWVNDYWHNQLLIAAGAMDEIVSEGTQLSPEEEAMLAAALESEHQEIPVNSQTITVDETTSRFSGAIWYEEIQKQTVTLAGVGGIGRFGNLINF